MEYWDGIIACGLQDEPVASLADLFDDPPPMERVKREIISSFRNVFEK
jgi:lipoate-protein ligase B